LNRISRKLEKAMRENLIEDMKMDFDDIGNWNPQIIKEFSEYGYKKNELNLLYKFFIND
jgi:hypothetical protein